MVALVGVLLLGILKGVMLAAIASMLMLIGRVARPKVARLGRIPGTRRFSNSERNPDNEPVPGALLLRPESSILYFNVDHVRDAVWKAVLDAGDSIRLVVCDLSAASYIDTAGARMLSDIQEELKSRGARLKLVEVHAEVRDLLRAEGLEEQVGKISRRHNMTEVIDEFLSEEPATPSGDAAAGAPGR
jgi:anti-anti-sigma factor